MRFAAAGPAFEASGTNRARETSPALIALASTYRQTLMKRRSLRIGKFLNLP